MSPVASPVESTLPHRSSTLMSSTTGRASLSDDDVIPDSDSNETTRLLDERLRAWKHMCGYLEEYVSVTAKVQKSQAKDYEKILKSVSDPLREGHHFSQSVGGVAALFENIRSNTQGMVNGYLETEKNLKGTILPTLERLHKEIKNKSKELHNSTSKSSKAVEKARSLTQKHIELLAQHVAAHDASAANKLDLNHDPYILRRGINHRLNKQVIEENNNRKDVLAVQNNFQQFEAHVLETVQTTLDQFVQIVGGQLDRNRIMYSDMLGNAQKIPLDFEWVNFLTSNAHALVDPDAPPRSLTSITFPNQDHRATKPLIEGSLERKSRAVLKGYSSGYYVITPARYLHEFKDDDDFRKDPSPELSLYLPDCVIGSIDGSKFSVKGKDLSGGKVGSAFHTITELNFKAHTPGDAEKWYGVIKDSTKAPVVTAQSIQPTSPVAATTVPPAYAEKEGAAAAANGEYTPTTPATAAAPAGHYHIAPGGSAMAPVAPATAAATAAAAAAAAPEKSEKS